MKVLFLILSLGFILRILGIHYGLPYPLISDEEVMIGGALKMLEIKSLIPAFHPIDFSLLYYPIMLPYLYAAIFTIITGILFIFNNFPSLSNLQFLVFQNLDLFFLGARFTSVILSCGTIFIIYKIGVKIFSSKFIGLASALILCIDYIHIMQAQAARHWSATVFLIWLVALLSIYYFKEPKKKLSILMGIFSGIGFGVSYIGGSGLFFALFSYLYTYKKKPISYNFKNILFTLIFFILFVLFFILIFPQTLHRLFISSNVLPLHEPKSLGNFLAVVSFYVKAIWFSDPLMLILLTLFIPIAYFRKSFELFFLAFLISMSYFLFLYLFMPVEDRYIIVLIPLFSLMGGYVLDHFINKLKLSSRKRDILMIILVFLFLYSLAIAVKTSYLLYKKDNRQLAIDWAISNISQNSSFISNLNGVRLNPTIQSLKKQIILDPASLKAEDKWRLRNEGNSKFLNQREVLNLANLSSIKQIDINNINYAKFLKKSYTYYIFDDFSAKKLPVLHEEILRNSQKVIEFKSSNSVYTPPMLRTTILVPYHLSNLFYFDRLGPNVAIWKISN
jgi:hypothetical protein